MTSGQCYQVSFDAASAAHDTILITNIDLIDINGNIIQTQWIGEIDPKVQMYTPYFNLNLGIVPVTGYYAFQLTASVDGQTCILNSVVFEGIYNSNSSVTKCP
ncbi:1108_t:CDS:2 [Ambispora gerdemannii]|uniref:1108_t:CDS:1 n=1 Tax=Ambispora gerdemannii TaxID=144530 RepID=A0A9N9EZ74_9GLOM|nr:1108_t:CDS:2 [Ambispora gerdemannii]